MTVSYSARGEAFSADQPRLWVAKKNLEPYFDPGPDGKRIAVLQAEDAQKSGPEQVVFLENLTIAVTAQR